MHSITLHSNTRHRYYLPGMTINQFLVKAELIAMYDCYAGKQSLGWESNSYAVTCSGTQRVDLLCDLKKSVAPTIIQLTRLDLLCDLKNPWPLPLYN